MSASDKIDKLIEAIEDWRGATFAAMRKAILAADKDIIEEWKWMGSPVWSKDGIIAVANAHKGKVKLTFDYGAKIADPDRLFNNGFEGNQRRAIDFLEGDKVNATALKKLVKAAIAFNTEKAAAKKKKSVTKTATKAKAVKKR